MPELHDLLERRAADYQPPSDLLARVHERRRRRQRTRRVGTGLVVLLVAVVAVGGLSRLPTPSSDVVFEQPPDALVGTWESIDTDGSYQTMDIRAVDGDGYEVVVDDDGASVCSGAPSTMTGTGRLDGAALVIPTPKLTCGDGSTRVPLDGSSLEELRDYTLVHDPATDTLTDSLGVQWWRPGATPDVVTGEAFTGAIWPQSTIDEVREAQDRADAGDPDVTWQVSPAIYNDTEPGDAAIFTRYLRDVLGWESFRWSVEGLVSTAKCNGSRGCSSYELDFVRCAPDKANPLYPEEGQRRYVQPSADGTTCAPTIDDFTYETVTVVARQPLLKGPKGIWVVSDSYPARVFRQTAPLPEAKVADALDEFLQARVDGEGAAKHLAPYADDIPLLYVASNGARYERFDYDLRGPDWPQGSYEATVRLYTSDADTVVEQQCSPGGTEQLVWLSCGPQTTTENGQYLPQPYDLLDGDVTFAAALPWYISDDSRPNALALRSDQVHDGPVDDRRGLLAVVVDPRPVGPGCRKGPAPADAEELVRSIQADPDLQATAAVTSSVGGVEAWQMDVTMVRGVSECAPHDFPPVLMTADQDEVPGLDHLDVPHGHRMRLYLLDLPEGSTARTLVITFRADEPAFESLLEEAPPILNSFEFRTP